MNKKILINQIDEIHIISTNEVLYCIASNGYCNIFLINGEHILSSKTLNAFSKELDESFVRISQSCLINSCYIKNILKREKEIILATGVRLHFTIKYSQITDLFNG